MKATNYEVSTLEKNVLNMICEGHTLDQIGRKLGMSGSLVGDLKNSMMNRFNAENTAHLLFMANSLGHVHLKCTS